jgi:predicted PurR-regulated permease PerM
MKTETEPPPDLHGKVFVVLVVLVSLAFIWILLPFYAAIFWATVLSIIFTPVYRRLARSMGQRRSLAALVTLGIIVFMVILPCALIAGLLLQEAAGVYERVKSGQLDFGQYLQQIMSALPGPITMALERFGLLDVAELQARVSAGLMASVQFIGAYALSIGQNTLEFIVGFFIMLYLLYFLLRDGGEISKRIAAALPLDAALQRSLSTKFATVVRATVKGNIVIAVLQGTLGGLIFWIMGINAPVFWGVVMAFLSLLPAVGAGLVWAPVAIYLFVTGSIWAAAGLTAYGVLVIGLVDNILRPFLVGKDTKLPDYIVLISTLGGMAVFGLNGFVIGPLIAAMFIAVWAVVATSPGNNI